MRKKLVFLGLLFVLLLGVGGYKSWGYFSQALPPLRIPTPEPAAPKAFVDTTDPNDLLPDLLPLPARDLRLERVDGKVLLRFSTTYYNQGRGPVELRADPKTAGIRADIERTVLQRIYTKDGGYREVEVGTFLWHQEHLHYHFTDFITYDLESLDSPNHPDLSGKLIKSTYCLRDVSRVHVTVASTTEIPKDAGYKICGKELQGVSVGWGDTYYHDYPGQSLDITELSSGRYKMTFVANPDIRLEEVRYDNNISETVFKLDMENFTVEVLSETPAQNPEIDHVHLDDPFGTTPRYPAQP